MCLLPCCLMVIQQQTNYNDNLYPTDRHTIVETRSTLRSTDHWCFSLKNALLIKASRDMVSLVDGLNYPVKRNWILTTDTSKSGKKKKRIQKKNNHSITEKNCPWLDKCKF